MVQRVSTVTFEGIEARAVDVQVQVAPGLPAFAIVGTIKPILGDNRPLFVVNDGQNLLSPVRRVLSQGAPRIKRDRRCLSSAEVGSSIRTGSAGFDRRLGAISFSSASRAWTPR
jgi:hypothetical protein